MVAAAVIGSAVIGAGASYAASNQQRKAAQGARNAEMAANKAALDEQTKLSEPYRQLGEEAIPQLRSLLGIGDGGNTPEQRQAILASTPGYQFARDEGLKGTKASAGSMGMALSGNTLKALDQYGTGLADQTYQSAVGNLMGVTGLGQAAAAGQAANVGASAGTSADIQGGYYTNLGNINAANVAGMSNALQSGISQATTQSILKDIYGSGRSGSTLSGSVNTGTVGSYYDPYKVRITG